MWQFIFLITPDLAAVIIISFQLLPALAVLIIISFQLPPALAGGSKASSVRALAKILTIYLVKN